MKQNDYWERFLESGSVADYLAFRGKCVVEKTQMQEETAINRNYIPMDTVREHAGFSDGYRNDFKVDTGR